MKRSILLGAVALLSVLAVACGSEPSSGGGGGGSEPETALEVTLMPRGEQGPSESATLECPSEDSAAACEALADVPQSSIDPVPANQACTDLFGGADVVRIEGTLEGTDTDVELNRSGGCEIDRFEGWTGVLEQLFPDYEPGSSIQPPE